MKQDTTVFESRPEHSRGLADRKHGGFPIPRERMAADEVRGLCRLIAGASMRAVAKAAGVGETTLEKAISNGLVTGESAAALRAYLERGAP